MSISDLPGQPPLDPQPSTAATGQPAASHPASTPTTGATSVFRRRRAVIAILVLLVALGGGALTYSLTQDQPELPPGAVAVDAWAPYWALDDAAATLENRLDDLRELSPFWFAVDNAANIQIDEFAPETATSEFIEQVRSANQVALVPSIRDELPAGSMAAVLANPTLRALHIENIVAFASQIDADGIDIDYEKFAFSDGRDTWAATRPNWVAFIKELSAALHAEGRTLSVSIPPIYDTEQTSDSGYWVYDHGTIIEHIDHLRIMTYDFSVQEPGAIAPLDWVQRSIDGVSAAMPPEFYHRLVLGIPSYGYNWVTGTTGECPESAEGRTTVTAANALDLAERRGGTPVLDPLDLEWSFTYDLEVSDGALSCTQHRLVRWIDAQGAAERVKLARRAGWGGVGLWALGYEDDAVWTAVTNAAVEPLSAASSNTNPGDSASG